MIIHVRTNTSPKAIGADAYNQKMDDMASRISQVLPQAIVYSPESENATLDNHIVIVKDNFSFGTGGHMRKATARLYNLFFQSRKCNITFILLQPNTKHNWIFDEASSVICKNLDDFLDMLLLAKERHNGVIR